MGKGLQRGGDIGTAAEMCPNAIFLAADSDHSINFARFILSIFSFCFAYSASSIFAACAASRSSADSRTWEGDNSGGSML